MSTSAWANEHNSEMSTSPALRDANRGPDDGEILNQARASAAQDLAAGSPGEVPAARPSEVSAACMPRRRSLRVNFGMRRASSPASVPDESRMANRGRGR
jgi:hypothetical protein